MLLNVLSVKVMLTSSTVSRTFSLTWRPSSVTCHGIELFDQRMT